MKQYHDLLKEVLYHGTESEDRTGTGTVSLFSPKEMHFDLRHGFPLVTTKKVFWKGVVEELLWFLRGETNIKSLVDKGVHIWDEWADKDGNLGPVYGAQWRDWGGFDKKTFGIDQIANLIQGIKDDPFSRRHIISAWNVADLDRMALAPCHCFFQVYVRDGRLSLKLYQRSADLFLGVPFNIASYALLTHLLAHQTGLKPGKFIHSFGDAHIYLNHMDQVQQQLRRHPMDLPKLHIYTQHDDISKYEFGDFILEGYDPWPAIKAPVAV